VCVRGFAASYRSIVYSDKTQHGQKICVCVCVRERECVRARGFAASYRSIVFFQKTQQGQKKCLCVGEREKVYVCVGGFAASYRSIVFFSVCERESICVCSWPCCVLSRYNAARPDDRCVHVRESERVHVCVCVCVHVRESERVNGVATMSRLLEIIGLFCKRALYNRRYFAKETYNLRSLLIVATPYVCVRELAAFC